MLCTVELRFLYLSFGTIPGKAVKGYTNLPGRAIALAFSLTCHQISSSTANFLSHYPGLGGGSRARLKTVTLLYFTLLLSRAPI